MIILYALFALSAFFPVYTYALYPFVLKTLKGKEYKKGNIEPKISIIVVGDDVNEKLENIKKCDYTDIEIICGDYDSADRAKGDIILFTDTKTLLDISAIREIVKSFADERVACVIGQQTNPKGNSAFWKYENLIKRLESRIGCVSGANTSIFAVRKRDLPEIPDKVVNKPFFIVTKITEAGRDIVFHESAKAYEGESKGTNFDKHVNDAVGYWQAFKLFPKMLKPRHGSFVYISHRVMKWFVWLNMVSALITSGILSVKSCFMRILFIIQLILYLIPLIYRKRDLKKFGKLINIWQYFISLNSSYLVGLFKYVTRGNK